jgi:nucleotide-binding universal stress UspA family protein
MLKILIPVDGSPEALVAVYHALHMVSQGLRAQFVVANVQDPANLYELVVAHDPEVLEKVRQDAGTDLMRSAVDLLRSAGQEVESCVVTGDIARMLAEIVEEAHCHAVIMMTHGTSMLGAAIQGSVSQELLHMTRVPVTLVKTRAPVDAAESD